MIRRLQQWLCRAELEWRDELLVELRVSLREYGTHKQDCDLVLQQGTCSCSLEEALGR